ncbi:MAG: lipid-binding SYLF domain-containing protein [Caulobacterales bacterium]|nr:lipid-binding SYLF domain-containing protein [Caulobacterales bacterium]MCA0373737.1 lipid-binding SYLF domain-containing protein [Pseudomonadota bacterium]
MKIFKTALILSLLIGGTLVNVATIAPAFADSANELNRQSQQSLKMLLRDNSAARDLARTAKAILIFPRITKAGLVFGAAFGEGELTENGKPTAYFNSFTGSWGLQAGAQSYGYVVFLMNEKAVDYIHNTDGWEFGIGPTIVLVNQGMAANLSTSTAQDDAYAFIYNQQGLMAGLGIEGTKITRIHPKK